MKKGKKKSHKKSSKTKPKKSSKSRVKRAKKSSGSGSNNQLVPYIKDALAKGYSKSDIKKALLAKEWDGKDIDTAFKFAERPVKKEVKSKKSGKKIKENKPVKLRRVPSGIHGFDRIIGGGFEENSVNLVVGNSGGGKTIFAMQFLIEGIKNNENCLYITFEEKKEEFFRNMLKFGWDLDKLEKEGKFVFLEYSPEKIRVMLEEGGGTVESIILKHKITRLVIDSVSSFALLFKDELTKREAALQLFDIIRNWECTSLLTLQEDPVYREEGSSTSLEFEADSIILLYFIRLKNRRRRLIEVLKMRGTNHSTEIFSFEITKAGVHVGGKVAVDGKIR
ncbi:MAG: ATPase domain-containing protein [archaeon]